MKKKNIFTIKYVADRTGIPPHLIRTWESRYSAVTPKRTKSNRRVYCQRDILKLRLLKGAVDAGHQISRIAEESTTSLNELLNLSGAELTERAPAQPNGNIGGRSAEDYLRISLHATVNLDPDKLMQSLSQAAVHLTRRAWVEDLITPMFCKIGERWSSGKLKIVNEHLASNCARNLLWDMLRAAEISSGAPKIIVGTPVGHWHELGALSAALAAVEAGWRQIYVGTNLPAEEFASALVQFNAACIGLSITHSLNDSRIRPELLKLRRCIGPGTDLLVGGLGATAWDGLLEQVRAKRINAWEDMTTTLYRLPTER